MICPAWRDVAPVGAFGMWQGTYGVHDGKSMTQLARAAKHRGTKQVDADFFAS
jgi:hypothetical protein